MKMFLYILVGIMVAMATNVSLADGATVLRGKIKEIYIDKDYNIVIKLESTSTTTHTCWAEADSPLVPIIAMIYQTQSTCKIYTPNFYTDTTKEIQMIRINREDSITNTNVMNELEDIMEKLEEIENQGSVRPVWR